MSNILIFLIEIYFVLYSNDEIFTEPPDQTSTSPPTLTSNLPQRIFHNSFDIINPLTIDEGGEQKRKPPPIVFRAGTREVHNKLEKHRRAHLKECFELLKRQLPLVAEEKKTSNLSILHSANKFIQFLKKRERELEHEMERLAREKIAYKQKLAVLRKEVPLQYDGIDFSNLLSEVVTSPLSSPVNSPDKNGSDGVSSSTDTVSESSASQESSSVITSTSEQKTVKLTLPRPVVPASINGIKEVFLNFSFIVIVFK